MINLILLITAAICFVLAALQPGSLWNRLVAGGLAAFIASMLVVRG